MADSFIKMPCIRCGVQNSLKVRDSEAFLFVCPGCHAGQAYIRGVIYTFRGDVLRELRERHGLVVSGEVLGTDRHDRFKNVRRLIRGSRSPQKGSQLTDEYISKLGSSLGEAISVDDVIKSLEDPGY